MAAQNLDTIVEQAVSAAPEALKDVIEESPVYTQTVDDKPKEEPKPKEESKKTEAEPELDEFGLTPEQQIEGKQLLAALRNPAKAPIVVDFLAKQMGYEKPETKIEAVKTAKGMVDELKEALGSDLAYLAEKMGPVFEKHLKDSIEEVSTKTSELSSKIQLESLEKQASVAQDQLASEYFVEGAIPEKLAKEMSKVMNVFEATENQSMKGYLEDVMFLAARRTGIALNKISKQEKIVKNRSDVPSRLASNGSLLPKVGESSIHPSRQMSLTDAIAKAMGDTNKELGEK
jgi:uncharacterized protein (DUF2164 family)